MTKRERAALERLVRRPGTQQGLAVRCRVVLLDEHGLSHPAIPFTEFG